MEIVSTLSSWGPAVVAMGFFDGLHAGHHAVLDRASQRADELDATTVVITFDRHPATVVRPGSAPRLLTHPDHKYELLESHDVDVCVVVPFDDEQASEPADSFIVRVVEALGAGGVVVVGRNFDFGYRRKGNVELLESLVAQAGFDLDVVPLVSRSDGINEPVSSTAIRRALDGGEITTANKMLGRPFELRAPVVSGDQIGQVLGFPTANLDLDPEATHLPADGVYAGRYVRPDGSSYPAHINVTQQPTFYLDGRRVVKTHLVDFAGDNDALIDELAVVQFLRFIRSDWKFNSVDLAPMADQLGRDVATIRTVPEALIADAVRSLEGAEQQLQQAIDEARSLQLPWKHIGQLLGGIKAKSARKRFGNRPGTPGRPPTRQTDDD